MGCGCRKNSQKLKEAIEEAKAEKLLTEEQIRLKDIESENRIVNSLQELLGRLRAK